MASVNGKFFNSWLKEIGRSRMTGYRWIKEGKIKVESIYGRKYISSDEIARFFREGKEATGLAKQQLV